ncbi:MAG: acylphosphatase [Methanotrichaceae archaeon]
MRRLIAYVSGRVQQAGYRSKVVTIAKAFGVRGSIQNLPDGRVKVIAEGKEADLERFADALKMNNAIIDVTDLERDYSRATGEYEDFYKLVGEGETDERLDTGVEYLKELVEVTKNGFDRMEGQMERGFDRMDKGFGELGHKMDMMLDKQDVVIEEVRGVRYDLKHYMESRFDRIESEIGEIKGALREQGII